MLMIDSVNITEEELIIFENLYEKRAALNNLILVSENNELERSEELYTRFLNEYQKLEGNYRRYWNEISKKYQIYEKDGYYLNLDFATKTISLRKELPKG